VFSDSLQEITGIATRISHGKIAFFFLGLFEDRDSTEMAR
jgi:hypothetical protein